MKEREKGTEGGRESEGERWRGREGERERGEGGRKRERLRQSKQQGQKTSI